MTKAKPSSYNTALDYLEKAGYKPGLCIGSSTGAASLLWKRGMRVFGAESDSTLPLSAQLEDLGAKAIQWIDKHEPKKGKA